MGIVLPNEYAFSHITCSVAYFLNFIYKIIYTLISSFISSSYAWDFIHFVVHHEVYSMLFIPQCIDAFYYCWCFYFFSVQLLWIMLLGTSLYMCMCIHFWSKGELLSGNWFSKYTFHVRCCRTILQSGYYQFILPTKVHGNFHEFPLLNFSSVCHFYFDHSFGCVVNKLIH